MPEHDPEPAFRSAPRGCAVIVGSTGQDGYYLGRLLAERGHEIVGLSRAAATGIETPIDVEDRDAVADLVHRLQPAAVYYLAAHHRSSEDVEEDSHTVFSKSFAVHVTGPLNFVDAIQRHSPETRLFYAASSHVFGDPADVPQTEETPLAPTCVYGITKAAGLRLCRFYRRQHGVFASVGILYNHESPRRAPVFVGRKIATAAAEIKRGDRDRLVLGDLDAAIDWGAAEDYVDAMYRILSADEADDYIIASGEVHTVGEFVEIAFASVGLDHTRYVTVDPTLITKGPRRRQLVGNAGRLRERTGWRPARRFQDVVAAMVEAELEAGGK